MESQFSFVLNGAPVTVSGESTHMSLLQWLRQSGRTGSKEGCAEGDCGACTVAIVERDAHGNTTYRAINSCIALLPMFAGREVVTVEGLEQRGELHPVQSSMVEAYGSQCGYCTPGFILSMFEGYHRSDLDAPWKICDQLNGNLCRCTGYRPIREAMSKACEVRKSRAPDLFELRLKREASAVSELSYRMGENSFHRPTTLPELLRLRTEFPAAELVCGATEIGVYINKRFDTFPTLISTEGVLELRGIRKTERDWLVGGAATLTEMEEAFAGEFPMIDKMLWVFASRQIRNRASLAGNIVTASPIGDTPPLLLALDAIVEIQSLRGTREVPISKFFTGYRKTVLSKDEIVTTIRIPRGKVGATRLSNSYKVSKRRELDISIVAAAFVVDLDSNDNVAYARLAFGGVAATPVRAIATEQFLVGKAWNEATLVEACKVLDTEIHPIADGRSGDEYRSDLVTSLLWKFFRRDESEAQDRPLDFSHTAKWMATTPAQQLSHDSARGHVTGHARYVDDESRRRPMLEMWPVLATTAHGKLVKVDTAAAKSMPGVVCVLTAEDIPAVNDIGAVRHDEPLLASGEVLYHGQLIAVVVGESYDQCRRAAKLVSVETESLPAVIGLRDAIQKDSFHTVGHTIARGDVEKWLASSPHRLDGELEIGGQEHFYLESQAAWAERGDDGDVFVASSTQHPSEIQAAVSHVLGIARHRVVVESPRMGGGFGGKETQGNAFAALAALATWKTGRPARWQLDRDLDMTITGKRHPFHFRYDVGFDNDGRILAAKVDVTSDGGYALDLSESICDRALFHLDNSYYIPNVRFCGRVAKTNTTSHTAFRGFGGPQGMVAIEEVMDRISRVLGLAPETVRERNLYRGTGESNTTHYGQPLGDERLPAIWSRLKASSGFDERRDEIKKFNETSSMVKRGISITPVKFGISFTATFLNQAGASVLVYRDGTVQVNHAGTEMGQGLYTKMLGVAMRELGLSEARIRVMKTRTDKVPNTSATAASSGSDLNGQAVRMACSVIRERLIPIATALLGQPSSVRFEGNEVFDPAKPEHRVPFEEVVESAYLQQVSLSAQGFYRTPGIGYDRAKGRGTPFYYFAYGAAVSEVEVDGYSGMRRIRRVDILQDVGDSLNPSIDRGQIEGAFVQGTGWLTGEELKWDTSGRLLTHSASTYQIPSIGDAPAEFHVEFLKNAAQEGVIFGSKAVGEPPLMLAISVREAIRDAVASFGESRVARVDLASPATHEATRAAIRARIGIGAGTA